VYIKILFWNKTLKLFILKVDFTLEIFLQKRLIYINFKINFQYGKGLMKSLYAHAHSLP